jgi:hypothetical protein
VFAGSDESIRAYLIQDYTPIMPLNPRPDATYNQNIFAIITTAFTLNKFTSPQAYLEQAAIDLNAAICD